MPTWRTRTSNSVLQWRIVSNIHALLCIAYCIKDKLNNDSQTGLFALFDGHGGKQVADHVAERLPDEMRKEVAKNPSGDLSHILEQVFLRVCNH
jgi:serine/threonine protein phosphatase PrpC